MYYKIINDFCIEKKQLLRELHSEVCLPGSSFNKTVRNFWSGDILRPETIARLRRYVVAYPELEKKLAANKLPADAELYVLKDKYAALAFPNALSIKKDADLQQLMNTLYKMMTALYYLSAAYDITKNPDERFPQNCCDIASEAMFRSLLYKGIPSVMVAVYNICDHAVPFIPLIHKDRGPGFLIFDPTADQFDGRQPNCLKLVWGTTFHYTYSRYTTKKPDMLLYFNTYPGQDRFCYEHDPFKITAALESAFTRSYEIPENTYK